MNKTRSRKCNRAGRTSKKERHSNNRDTDTVQTTYNHEQKDEKKIDTAVKHREMYRKRGMHLEIQQCRRNMCTERER